MYKKIIVQCDCHKIRVNLIGKLDNNFDGEAAVVLNKEIEIYRRLKKVVSAIISVNII